MAPTIPDAPLGHPLRTLTAYRIISVCAFVVIVGFHWIMGDATAEDISLLERFALASLFALFALGTYVSDWVRARARHMFEALLFAVALWTVRNAMFLEFSADQTLALLIGVFTISLLFQTQRGLVAFHGTMLLAVAAAMRVVPPQDVQPMLITATQGAMLLVSWLITRERDRAIAGLQRLSLVASKVHNGVLLLDAEGRAQWANAGFVRSSGIPADQLQGASLATLFPDARCSEALDLIQRAIADGGALSQVELLHSRPGGEDRHVSLDLTPVHDDAGHLEQYIAVESDISEAHRRARELFEDQLRTEEALQETERQLIHAQRLEAVGRLAGGVAHDFNNLLTVIISYAELGLAQVRPEDPVRNKLEQILKSGNRAAGLTRQLLAFSRKQVLEPRVLDPSAVVGDISRMLHRIIGEDIEVITDLPGGLGRVEADPGQLEQLIVNLAVNARDAMPDGGKLTLQTMDMDADEYRESGRRAMPPGRYVMLVVSDTGVGMDAATLGRVFEPFFTTKEPGKGTGLGLATVYGIVRQSGGYIWAFSEPGKGTTFEICLPRTDRSADTDQEATEVLRARGSGSILVVEDEPMVRDLVETVLDLAGYDVTSAGTAVEALEIAAQDGASFDLVLTDVVMPEMNGAQLVEELTPRFPDAAILYMSGYTEDAIVQHGVLEAGVDLLRKPFTTDELLERVRQVMERG